MSTALNSSAKRRSWLIVPASCPDAIAAARAVAPDVIVLDLVEFVLERDRPGARAGLPAVIADLRGGPSELFVQVDTAHLTEDLAAAVHPGLGGVVLTGAEQPAEVRRCDETMTLLAERAGVPTAGGSPEIVLGIESAKENWAAYELATASERVRTLTLGRVDLKMDLRAEPSGEIHLLVFLLERLALIAAATGRGALGAWWRAPDRGLLASGQRTREAARRARAIGFGGSMCIAPEQVRALEEGFTPSDAETSAASSHVALFEALETGGADSMLLELDGERIDRAQFEQWRQLACGWLPSR